MDKKEKCFDCSLGANYLMSNGEETIYACTNDMRKAYNNLSEGGRRVTSANLLESREPIEVFPIPAERWKGFPKPVVKFLNG